MRVCRSGLMKRFASKKEMPALEEVRNNNLRFQSDNWWVHLFPFYPQMYKKKNKEVFEISSNSIVLAMTFINSTVSDDIAWANRKSITFKFKQLGYLIDVKPGSGQKALLQSHTPSRQSIRTKHLALEDITEKKNIKLHLQSYIEKVRESNSDRSQELEWDLVANMPYRQFRVMHKLIQTSLFELSGWRFMLELQRKQMMGKIENSLSVDKEFEELIHD